MTADSTTPSGADGRGHTKTVPEAPPYGADAPEYVAWAVAAGLSSARVRRHGANHLILDGEKVNVFEAEERIRAALAKSSPGMPQRRKPTAKKADTSDDDLWIEHKNGTRSLNIQGAANQIMYGVQPVLVDVSGGLWVYRDGVFVSDSRHVARELVSLIGQHWTPAHASNVERYIRTMGDLLDFNEVAHSDLVNFRDTMLNWRTGERVAHDPSHRSTFQIAAEWDPSADCPLFDQYVTTMLEPEAATLLWQVVGYSMLSGNPMQVFVFLEGSGGNGKGVIERLLVRLLGPANVSSLSMTEIDGDNRFKLASMVGRAANISGETPKTYIKDSSNLKKITGAGWVDVERKGVDSVQVMIHALPIFSVNEVPNLGDDSEGLFQRAIVIPFHRKAAEHKIAAFNEERLAGELPGIARKALEAVRAVRFDDPSARADGFTLGEAGQRARRDFREQANAELDWVSNYLRPASDHWMTPTELYREFGGTRPRPSRKFMRALRERFGDPVTAVPSRKASGLNYVKSINDRVNCYAVLVSEDRIDPTRELFGVPNIAQEAS